MAPSSPSVESKVVPSSSLRVKKEFNYGPFGRYTQKTRGGEACFGIRNINLRMHHNIDGGRVTAQVRAGVDGGLNNVANVRATKVEVLKDEGGPSNPRVKSSNALVAAPTYESTPTDTTSSEAKRRRKEKGKAKVKYDVSCGPAHAEMRFKNIATGSKDVSVSVHGRMKPSGKVHFRLKSSTGKSDVGYEYTLRKTSNFMGVYHHYASLIDSHASMIVVKQGNFVVHPQATPRIACISDGDILTVYGRDATVNTNRNVKMITITQCHNFPLELTIPVPLNQHLEDIWAMWARFLNLKHEEFHLIRNNLIIPPVGTVAYNNLKNGDKLLCFYVHGGSSSSESKTI